jgi:hypothetical protein
MIYNPQNNIGERGKLKIFSALRAETIRLNIEQDLLYATENSRGLVLSHSIRIQCHCLMEHFQMYSVC